MSAPSHLGYFVKIHIRGKSAAYALRSRCMANGAESAVVLHDNGSKHVVKALFRGDFPEFIRDEKKMSYETVTFGERL